MNILSLGRFNGGCHGEGNLSQGTGTNERVSTDNTTSRKGSQPFSPQWLARCGYCGKALVRQDAKGGRFSYYICGTLNKKGAGSCPAYYPNSAKFEGLVVDKSKEYILTAENLTQLVRLVSEEMDSASKSCREELDIIADEVIETGKIGLSDLAPRIRELRNRQEKLQARRIQIENFLSDRRVELASLEIVKSYVDDLRNLLNNSSLAERRTFIRSFIKEAKVTEDEVLLTSTVPLSPRRVSEEKVGVLSTVQYGGPYWTVPELFFEKKRLIPALQQLLVSHLKPSS